MHIISSVNASVVKANNDWELLPWFDLQPDAPNPRSFTYNTFIKLLYMFRAVFS